MHRPDRGRARATALSCPREVATELAVGGAALARRASLTGVALGRRPRLRRSPADLVFELGPSGAHPRRSPVPRRSPADLALELGTRGDRRRRAARPVRRPTHYPRRLAAWGVRPSAGASRSPGVVVRARGQSGLGELADERGSGGRGLRAELSEIGGGRVRRDPLGRAPRHGGTDEHERSRARAR
jgi:hypothetical protein